VTYTTMHNTCVPTNVDGFELLKHATARSVEERESAFVEACRRADNGSRKVGPALVIAHFLKDENYAWEQDIPSYDPHAIIRGNMDYLRNNVEDLPAAIVKEFDIKRASARVVASTGGDRVKAKQAFDKVFAAAPKGQRQRLARAAWGRVMRGESVAKAVKAVLA
jgi:hypothetical protein